ncbi:MAG TPA: queuosine precursor transporter [Rhizomicrobium sp.]|nr:queuosine precursor transporter [Rhizomicrobium sp.]
MSDAARPTLLSRPLAVLICLSSLHAALLVTSMVAGAKLVALPFHLSASATVLSYTLTFVILDTLAELYGPAVSKFVITMGLVSMVLAAAYMETAAVLRGPGGIVQDAFSIVLSMSWRIWLAGWIAYVISQRLDVWSFLLLKRVGGIGASVAARAWFSLIFGQMIDTALFVTIAFAGVTSLLPLVAGQYAVKIVISTLTVPLVSVAVALGRRLVAGDASPRDGFAVMAETTSAPPVL